MEITSVQIILTKLATSDKEGAVAYANIIFNKSFVLKDVRLIRAKGKMICAMPNKEKTRECPFCNHWVGITFKYCSNCGKSLPFLVVDGKLYYDTAHPLVKDFRDKLESEILKEYNRILQGD